MNIWRFGLSFKRKILVGISFSMIAVLIASCVQLSSGSSPTNPLSGEMKNVVASYARCQMASVNNSKTCFYKTTLQTEYGPSAKDAWLLGMCGSRVKNSVIECQVTDGVAEILGDYQGFYFKTRDICMNYSKKSPPEENYRLVFPGYVVLDYGFKRQDLGPNSKYTLTAGVKWRETKPDGIQTLGYVRLRSKCTVENQKIVSVEYEELDDLTQSEEIMLDHHRFF